MLQQGMKRHPANAFLNKSSQAGRTSGAHPGQQAMADDPPVRCGAVRASMQRNPLLAKSELGKVGCDAVRCMLHVQWPRMAGRGRGRRAVVAHGWLRRSTYLRSQDAWPSAPPLRALGAPMAHVPHAERQ